MIISLSLAIWFLLSFFEKVAFSANTCGIFCLDGRAGDQYGEIPYNVSLRNANLRTLLSDPRQELFVSGFAWRMGWNTFEFSDSHVDFTPLDIILGELEEMELQLSLLLASGFFPSDLLVSSQSYWDPEAGKEQWRVVPWDENVMLRFESFIAALSNYETNGIPLKDNPRLVHVGIGLPGIPQGALRDRVLSISDFPGYSRSNLTMALQRSLDAWTSNFPTNRVSMSIGFWKIEDEVDDPPLWQEISDFILARYGSQVGYFMENLAADREVVDGPVTGYPTTTFAQTLYDARDDTGIFFQALTSWGRPFTGADKVENASPIDGMAYARTTYGTTYFEIYSYDIAQEEWADAFVEWESVLCSLPSAGSDFLVLELIFFACVTLFME